VSFRSGCHHTGMGQVVACKTRRCQKSSRTTHFCGKKQNKHTDQTLGYSNLAIHPRLRAACTAICRNKLPRIVSMVNVQGAMLLCLLSLFQVQTQTTSNHLAPMSHDSNVAPNVISSVLIAVCTAPHHFTTRQAIRNSWASHFQGGKRYIILLL
jgi:hypothetical protein